MDLKTHVAATLEIIGSFLGSAMYIHFSESGGNKYILWYNVSLKKIRNSENKRN